MTTTRRIFVLFIVTQISVILSRKILEDTLKYKDEFGDKMKTFIKEIIKQTSSVKNGFLLTLITEIEQSKLEFCLHELRRNSVLGLILNFFDENKSLIDDRILEWVRYIYVD